MARKLKSKTKKKEMYPEFDFNKWLDAAVHRLLADEENLDDFLQQSYEEALREEEESWPVETKRRRNRK